MSDEPKWPQPGSTRELEWKDMFGSHWEAQRVTADGSLVTIKLTADHGVWPDRDAARAKLWGAVPPKPMVPPMSGDRVVALEARERALMAEAMRGVEAAKAWPPNLILEAKMSDSPKEADVVLAELVAAQTAWDAMRLLEPPPAGEFRAAWLRLEKATAAAKAWYERIGT